MKIKTTFVLMLLATFSCACGRFGDVPSIEFPTPEPPPRATPLPELELKRDADLEKQIAKIAEAAKGKVGVAAVVLETGDAALLNPDGHFPMQSVYKLPIAMAVVEQFRIEDRSLDELVGVTKDDMVRQGQRSPLRDEHPDGGEFTVREMIRLALVESDGSASDVLIRVLGGADKVQAYLSQIGINDMKVVNTEKEIGKDWETQYQNWATPPAAVDVLRQLCSEGVRVGNEACSNGPLFEAPSTFPEEISALLDTMANSIPGPNRLRGLLPKKTTVAHKTGTSGTQNGITAATNDIGIISLPNGRHVAIAIFVSDSPADEKTRELTIAKIAKAVWDKWEKKS